jgi:hypothetical protein
MCCGCFSSWHEKVELLLEVTTLNVAAPLTLVLYGDAAVCAIATVVSSAQRSAVAMLATGTRDGDGARASDGT